jgi:hypothetical protein
MTMLLALGYFTALASAFLWKLFPLWNSAIPGGLQDTRLFLWNAWWVKYAIDVLHTNPFHTPMLFHPYGTQLISHDAPVWMALVTYFGQHGGLSMIASLNLWFITSWILSGLCTFGLVYAITHRPLPALVAGTFVMTHSYTLARAMQNWGQFNLYGIALFLGCLVRARRVNSTTSYLIAGTALAWTAACHYYFLIYSAVIWLSVMLFDLSPYSLRFSKKPGGAASRVVLGFVIMLGAIGIFSWVHPSVWRIGKSVVSMQHSDNPLFVMWILLMIWGAMHVRMERVARAGHPEKRKRLFHYAILGATALVLLSPLIAASLKLALSGGYPKQSILWKTHLRGPDLFSLFMPNPFHAVWGPAVSHWVTSHAMHPQDQAASLGWVCLGVVILAGLWRSRWFYLAVGATIMSMGTHLYLAQTNTWCPLPFFLFRLIPVLGNVRVPERWMAVGAIAWAVLLALSLLKLSAARGWSLRKLCLVTILCLLVENWPGIPAVATPPISPVYLRLKQEPPGGVLTVPFYIGDSSIGTGDALNGRFIFPWDHLWAQITHEKPILGGYVGRISRKIIDDYKADPFIHTLLDLEEHKIPTHNPEPAFGEYAYRNLGFQYVLVYPESTDPEALKYVLGSLPLELVEKDASVQLYRIN